jgi:hypothetical protein
MYSLMKKIITEKDIQRHVSLVELLLNHPKITVNELAETIKTTERTIFSDLQLIKSQLPPGWAITSDQAGIHLKNEQNLLTNELWEIFFMQSISVQLLKELLTTKKITTSDFLGRNGLSYETLNRHIRKLNQELINYKLQVQLNRRNLMFSGEEENIRIFYHRLLMPFTHNNYFFEDYSIHESHYFRFLKSLRQKELIVATEEIFGICWFFINTMRIKAGCHLSLTLFSGKDKLYALYAPELEELYRTEGVYLKGQESVFAFSCFLDSWNYNNLYPEIIMTILHQYPFAPDINEFVTNLAERLSLASLTKTKLAENLILLLLKYHESPLLIEQTTKQYHSFLEEYDNHYPELSPYKFALLEQVKTATVRIKNEDYFFYLLSLLIQQTLLAIKPNQVSVYFVFQGEPSWKAFLQQEIHAYLGKRVSLKPIELSQLAEITIEKNDLLVSNIPIDAPPIPVFYLSTVPTKNELDRLNELTTRYYL